MDGMVSFGNKRTYEEFKKQIPSDVKELFDKLRDYCLSLGKNVVEDIRMHRIVFGKSMNFRWFTDLEPQNDQILVKIQMFEIKTSEEINKLKSKLQNAYETIR